MAATACLALYCMGFMPYWWIRYGFPVKNIPAIFELGMVFWVIAVIIALIVTLKVISDSRWWRARKERKRQRKTYESSNDLYELSSEPQRLNLLWAWLRAKKQKVCPLIRVVD